MAWLGLAKMMGEIELMGTGTRKAPGALEKPSAEADQERRWGCRRTRTGPTRSAAIWLTERL